MHTIYYFSGTGNSLFVAKKIAEATEATLKPLLNVKGGLMRDQIGIVFPIHMNNLPRAVETFIKDNDFSQVTHLYAVATHMGLPGHPEFILDVLLKDQDSCLDEYFNIKMINNTPKGLAPKFLMSLNWEEDITQDKVEAMLVDVAIKLEDVVDLIQSKTRRFFEAVENGDLKIKPLTKLLWQLKGHPKLDFIVDESCTHCGICEKVCLTERIKVNTKVDFVKKQCHYCYACFNFCPEQAILVKHYEKKLGRYHHPEITANDIAQQKEHI